MIQEAPHLPAFQGVLGKTEEKEHSAGKWMDHVEGHFITDAQVIISAAQMLPIL